MTMTSGSYAPIVSRVSFRDSPFSSEEPDAFSDITSAESRLAASSKLEDVLVEASKNAFTTNRPRSVGSFFTSRSSERANVRARASSRSTSSRSRSAIEIRCRRGGRRGGRSSSRRSGRTSAMDSSLGDEQDAVDLVDLDELDLYALVAGRRQVLADVVGSDGKLAVASVDEHGELDAGRAAVVEERIDRRADRPPRVEDVVAEDARHPF